MCTIGGHGRHIGRQSTDISVGNRPTIGQQSTNASPDMYTFIGRLLADISVDYRSTIGRQSTD